MIWLRFTTTHTSSRVGTWMVSWVRIPRRRRCTTPDAPLNTCTTSTALSFSSTENSTLSALLIRPLRCIASSSSRRSRLLWSYTTTSLTAGEMRALFAMHSIRNSAFMAAYSSLCPMSQLMSILLISRLE